jgi:hypothetical protein
MFTHEQLIDMASSLIDDAFEYSGKRHVTNLSELATNAVNAKANLAQACVALAKEMREDKQAPIYPQIEELINVLRESTT